MLEFLNRFEKNRAGAMFCVALFCRFCSIPFFAKAMLQSFDRCILYRCEFHEPLFFPLALSLSLTFVRWSAGWFFPSLHAHTKCFTKAQEIRVCTFYTN